MKNKNSIPYLQRPGKTACGSLEVKQLNGQAGLKVNGEFFGYFNNLNEAIQYANTHFELRSCYESRMFVLRDIQSENGYARAEGHKIIRNSDNEFLFNANIPLNKQVNRNVY
jgi:hypothetical protein